MARKPFSTKRHLKRYGIWWVVLALVLILALGFSLGFRVGPGLSIVRAGTLTLTDLPESSSVYVDGKLRATVRAGGTYDTRLIPGTHAVIVDAIGMTPWHDGADIASGEMTTLTPLLVPQKIDLVRLKDGAESGALATIAAYPLPSAAAPLRAGCTDIALSGNRLIGTLVSGCTPEPAYLCSAGECGATELLAPVEKITSVMLVPGRTDAILITAGDAVYALDIDPRDPRFFAPVTRAVEPRIAPGADGTILLKDIDGLAYSFAL